MGKKLTFRVVPPLAWGITQFLFWSFRKEFLGHREARARFQQGQPLIWALWHSRSLMLPRWYHWLGYRPITVLVSRSFGGRLAGRMLLTYGFELCYGSSTRKGKEGQAKMIEAGQAGKCLAVTVDGPSGPVEVVKPGVVRMASATGHPIYPLTFFTEKCTRLSSWDLFILPHPFSRAVFIVGNAVRVPADADQATLEQKRLEVENELSRITREAENYFLRNRRLIRVNSPAP